MKHCFTFIFIGLLFNCLSQSYNQGIVLAQVKKEYKSQFLDRSARGSASISSYLKVNEVEPFIRERKARNTTISEYREKMERVYRLTFANDLDVLQKVEELKATGFFESVEPYYTFEVLGYQPNDPESDSTKPYNVGMNQLLMHDFYSAWAIEKGDTNLKIGIVDTGINYDQVDLQGMLKNNYADTIDGVNNDKDLYFADSLIDNFKGWDVADWDNDASLGPGSFHGASMATIISGRPDNNLHGLGTGFNCKYVPYKAAKDASPNSLNAGYDGMFLAAQQGCKVINCSWGTTNILPQIFSDLCDWVTYDYDALIVSSAGNQGTENVFRPASFNPVISTCALFPDSTLVFNASNYNYFVDLAAAGDGILMSDGSNEDYRYDKGTSIAAAVVSGLAGLVRSHFPELKAIQVKKQLEVTGVYIDSLQTTSLHYGKVGKMINPLRALTDSSNAGLEYVKINVNGGNGIVNKAGDIVPVELFLVNLLKPLNDVQIKLTALSGNFDFLKKTVTIDAGNTFDTLSTAANGFEIQTFPTADTLIKCVGRIEYSHSNGYKDHDYIFFNLKTSEITSVVDKNLMTDVSIFPTVVKDKLFIQKIQNNSRLELKDMEGRLVLSKILEEGDSEIRIDLPSGFYIVEVQTETLKTVSKIFKY